MIQAACAILRLLRSAFSFARRVAFSAVGCASLRRSKSGAGRLPMRTGADYREALRDGRKVWVMGEGWVADVTTHPATRAMVDEYALWYDRHLDPAWQRNPAVAARGRRGTGAVGLCRAEGGRGSGRHGPVLREDDFSQRRQHHPHPGLWQSDRARRVDRGASRATPRPSRSPRRRPIATTSPAPGGF